jgi:hypothetical protein
MYIVSMSQPPNRIDINGPLLIRLLCSNLSREREQQPGIEQVLAPVVNLTHHDVFLRFGPDIYIS